MRPHGPSSVLEARVDHGAFGYTKLGKDYYTIIQDWMKRRYDLEIETFWIVPVPKVLNAVSVTIQEMSDVGNGIIIQTPVYHAFRLVIEDNDRTIVEKPLIKDSETDVSSKMRKTVILELIWLVQDNS